LVLGVDTGIAASDGQYDGSRLVAAVRVVVPSEYANGFPPGMAVQITGAQARLTSASVASSFDGGVSLSYLTGDISRMASYSSRFTGAIGVAIDGTKQQAGQYAVVRAVTSGLAFVRVRQFDSTHNFAIPPIQRVSETVAEQHVGILDSNPCSCDSSVRVVAYLGNASTFRDTTNAPIVWAVVIV
jgi:hypothetical protein